MKIEEICQYLNELGILSIKNTSLFLSIYSGLLQNKFKSNRKHNLENNEMIVVLFAFLKKIISNDKELYELCSNIIDSHSKNRLIKLYQGICFLNKVIYHQVKNRFNHFLFLLFTKKYPKRKYFPYNALYAKKFASKLNEIQTNISFNNSNQRRYNNILNINEDNSISYISNKNTNKHYNKIVFNTGSEEGWKSENILPSRRKHSTTQPIIHMPDLVEKINLKKKEISMNNMKKKLYDAQIRINNYENIIPISIRNRKKEMKSREEEDYYNKLKEDKIYEKLTEKEIDQHNILDRLYRKEIIKKQEMKRKEKENKKRDKSPIDWDKVNNANSKKKYLNININSEDINSIKELMNKPQKNYNSSRDVFSFGKTAGSEKNKNNLNNNVDNINKYDFNNNNINKDNLNFKEQKGDKIMNDNQINKNIFYKNNNNYLNLKQLNENEIESNLNQNEEKENELLINMNEKNKNNPQYNIKYPFENINQDEKDEDLLDNDNYNNKEVRELDKLNQNQIHDINQIENDNNLPKQFISKKNDDKINLNEEEENEEEILINNNKLKQPNEQIDYQYDNYNEEEGEEDNEKYGLENEEIEYDMNGMNDNIENNINIETNQNDNKYEELFGENIEEYLDEENKE